ncbi:putative oxidoreductase [Methyloligella halotolerans]|uniref:Putative oxidoreductase n=1 Tax=Methyloligella halotolerans TaxID=1177755 RepID=A0A1E2RZC8_9HYPH|nr:SDR family NAD(P)-dependent oxidoreductase [Methyloligella halotolerans]ODA67583.1 putative oxidoreductase [Methyloligella halotolerans]
MADKYPWKVAWITGASGAICGDVARRLADGGVKVAATARPSEALDRIGSEHENITAYPADVLDADALKDCAAKIAGELGAIDLLIAGAGMYEPFDIDDVDVAGFAKTMDLNVSGVMNTVASALPAMLARRSGHIALMGSLFGYTGWPGNGGYGASKAAIINLAESLALELRKTGVDITLVSPGFVDTQLNASYEGKKHFVMSPERCAKRILKRLPGRPYEIAFPVQVALFLKLVRAMPNGVGRAMIRAFIKAMG